MTSPLTHTLGLGLMSLACAAAMIAPPAHADDKDGKKPLRAGIEFKETGVLQEIGLPGYPGALEKKNSSEDKSNVSIGLWGGPFGIKVQVAQFSSTDSVDKVASFYQQALAQYGKVLDCSEGVPRAAVEKGRSRDDRILSCEEDSPSKGQKLYKVGPSSRNFRLVSVQPRKDGTHFEVVRIVIGRQD